MVINIVHKQYTNKDKQRYICIAEMGDGRWDELG